jgi:hypothetical protein
MNVKELIELLKQFPETHTVSVVDFDEIPGLGVCAFHANAKELSEWQTGPETDREYSVCISSRTTDEWGERSSARLEALVKEKKG